MGAVKAKEIPVEAEFMSKFWKLVKRFWLTEKNDKYWDDLAAAVGVLHNQFPSDFCKKMLLAYMGYLDDKARREES